MKKVALVCLGLLLIVGSVAFTAVGESDKPPVKPPFEPFTIQYIPDPENPDTARDNLPIVKYNPEEGWEFYKVEPNPVENAKNKYRIMLDDKGLPIETTPDDRQAFHEMLSKVFDFDVVYQANANFYSDRFKINHFCLPTYIGGGEYNGYFYIYQKSFSFVRSDENKNIYTSSNFIDYALEENSYFAFDPRIGTIQIFDENLQFEQWDIPDGYRVPYEGKYSHKLTQREALNPNLMIIDSSVNPPKCQRILGLFGSDYYGANPYHGYVEYFANRNTYLDEGRVKHGIPFRRINDNLFIDPMTFADDLGMYSGSWDFENNKSSNKHFYFEHYVFLSINQRITFELGSKTVKTRYGDDIELPIKVFVNEPDEENVGKVNIFDPVFYASIFPVLDLIPRFEAYRGYFYRPMNDSILISKEICYDSFYDERIFLK
ncbi:MAG TPA: hypothetical protein PKV16_04165 [Caldisericia bacterium]|nr:hypothetical protein [Caldisericia bacterium]HPF48504.1 hypothetical protein [Caldisericia bacterium]HPI83315.1 hypothetical protein [Caldisericia bacterium]HPQ92959.1 hypothetical protein [Caldisericia bacterium]HRV75207.1 hypothetical protein [Caldisericia bacterium]